MRNFKYMWEGCGFDPANPDDWTEFQASWELPIELVAKRIAAEDLTGGDHEPGTEHVLLIKRPFKPLRFPFQVVARTTLHAEPCHD